MKDKTEEAIINLIRVLMKRRLLPKEDADYILKPLGVKSEPAGGGLDFYSKDGKRIGE